MPARFIETRECPICSAITAGLDPPCNERDLLQGRPSTGGVWKHRTKIGGMRHILALQRLKKASKRGEGEVRDDHNN